MSDGTGLRKQGSDVVASTLLDLASCLNRYGPPPSVMSALSELDPIAVHRHPYEAGPLTEELYAKWSKAPVSELIACRAGSEAIWNLARALEGRRVVLPLPSYTEYLLCFPNAERLPGAHAYLSVEQLSQAAETGDVVIFSNPHNPTGNFLGRDEIVELAHRHPACLFVVDESYADFAQPDANPSVAGCDADNVLSFNSPSKFFGMGGVRVGAMWTASKSLAEQLRSLRTTWPLSMIEVALVEKAFADEEWQTWARVQLAEDAEWLDGWLAQQDGVQSQTGPLHFRFLSGDVVPLYERLAKVGVAVRMFDEGHGLNGPTLRMTAPRFDRRELVASA